MVFPHRLRQKVQACLLCVSVLLSGPDSASASDFREYSEEPSTLNNFAEAKFRLWIPEMKSPLKGVLFLALGTDSDGLHLTANPRWQKLATDLQFGLVSCHLRGEGEAYEMAGNGSGQALLNALNDFSRQTKRPELAELPLILWGHSAGGQFAYHFACWKPERVLGFVSIKWASYTGPPDPLVYRIPALIIAGEHDESGRNQNLANVYQNGRSQSAPWAFLLEKNAGHGLDQTDLLVFPFIQALATGHRVPSYTAEIDKGLVQARPYSEDAAPRIGWLPDRETAAQWKKLHQPCDLNALQTALPNSSPIPGLVLSPSVLDWGKVPQDTQPVSKSIDVVLTGSGDHATLRVNTRDSRLRNDVLTTAEGFRINVTLDPRGLPVGPYRSQALIQYGSKGKKQESAELSIYGMITSDVSAQPASLYVGVLPRKSQASFRLKIRSTSGSLELIKASSTEPGWIQPHTLESTPGILEFDCLVEAGERIGRRYGELRFTVQTDQRKEIVVPYIGFVRKN